MSLGRAGVGVFGAILALALTGADAGGAAMPPPASTKTRVNPGESDFRQGYELLQKKDYTRASAALLRSTLAGGPAAENQEWALFFLGISLKELGLSHAAADVLSHLVSTKPNARIVSYGLEILEEITRTKPFDREGVLLETLCDQEYGFVEQRHVDFISYYQGLYDWDRGYEAWGDEHFAKIRKDSPYYFRYIYQKALRSLGKDDEEGAAALLRSVLLSPVPDPALKNDARVTLARIAYEQGRFADSDEAYRDVDTPPVQQARYLLERAWGQYRSGRLEKAMGLLYAFEAPSFWRHFSPEYFILKSLIYKDVCHYPQALRVVQEFHKRYDRALSFLYQRGDIFDSDEFLLVLSESQGVKRLCEFLELLQTEKKRASGLGSPELTAYLTHLYSLQIDETTRQLRALVRREFETLAEDLLQYEEQAHLIDYEVGLDLYQRAAGGQKPGAAEAKGSDKEAVVYAFQGEFWNDELADYRVVLDNRCDSPEEWDVFFK